VPRKKGCFKGVEAEWAEGDQEMTKKIHAPNGKQDGPGNCGKASIEGGLHESRGGQCESALG